MVAQSRQHYFYAAANPFIFSFHCFICLVAVLLVRNFVCDVVWCADSVWDSNAVAVSSLCNLGQCTNCRFDILSKLQSGSDYFNRLGFSLLVVGMLGVRPQRQLPFQVLCRSVQKSGRSKNEALTTPKEKVHKIHKLYVNTKQFEIAQEQESVRVQPPVGCLVNLYVDFWRDNVGVRSKPERLLVEPPFSALDARQTDLCEECGLYIQKKREI